MPLTPEEQHDYQILHSMFGGGSQPAPRANPQNIPVAQTPFGATERYNTALQAGKEISVNKAKTQNEIDLARPTAEKSLRQAIEEGSKQITLADKVASQVEGEGSGAVGIFDARTPALLQKTQDTISNIEGLDAGNFVSAINGLKAASPTGATGVGSMTEREGDKLQKANFNFDRSQSEPQFIQRVNDYKKSVNQSMQNTLDTFNQTYKTNYKLEDFYNKDNGGEFQTTASGVKYRVVK